jgi:hypothetical protein
MADPSAYTYSSPLEGYEDAPSLSNDLNEDGKSYKNPQPSHLSKAYDQFTAGVTNGVRGGFDASISPSPSTCLWMTGILEL